MASCSSEHSLFRRSVACLVAFAMSTGWLGDNRALVRFPVSAQAGFDAAGFIDTRSPADGRVNPKRQRLGSVPQPVRIDNVSQSSQASTFLAKQELVQLFDGTSKGMVIPPAEPGSVDLQLDHKKAIHELTIKGRGRLRIAAIDSETGQEVFAEQGRSITLNGDWVRIALPQPIKAGSVRLSWASQPQGLIREVVVWGRQRLPSGIEEARGQGDQDTLQTLGEVFPLARQADATFEGLLPRSLDGYASASLRYRLSGLSHWTQVEQSINGLRSLRSSAPVSSHLETKQEQPVSLTALRAGRNTLRFPQLLARDTGLKIEQVELVLRSESGTAHAPIPSESVGTFELPGDSLAHELNVYIRKAGAGMLVIQGPDQRVQRVALSERTVGWHRFEVEPGLTRASALSVRIEANSSTAKRKPSARIGQMLVSYSSLRDPQDPRMDYVVYRGQGDLRDLEVRGIPAKTAIQTLEASNGAELVQAEDGSFLAALGSELVGGKNIRARFADGTQHEHRVQADPCVLDGAPALSGLVADVGAAYSVCIEHDKGGLLRYGELTLHVPPGALARNTRISVRPLSGDALAQMERNHKNVTAGTPGFRLGPPGLTFRKPALLSLPYEPSVVPPGQQENQVYAMYYDEALARWSKVPRRGRPNNGRVESATEHFTDFVAATIPTPETPGPKSMDAGAIAQLAQPDPLAGVQRIAAPVPNAYGTASLSHPIVVPPGLNNMAPRLAFTYSSGAGNGMVGMGWDVPISSISVVTRHGVPRYSDEDSLIYELDGAELVNVQNDSGYFDSRPLLRSPDANVTHFARKVEGRFERILRVGSSAPYQWQVHRKDGSVAYYGETETARLSDPDESQVAVARTRVGRWYLERERDRYGNEVRYYYEREEACLTSMRNPVPAFEVACPNKYTRIYPKKIQYTIGRNDRNVALPPSYEVRFDYYSGVRPDIVSSARHGFLEVTRRRLAAVTVAYGRKSLSGPQDLAPGNDHVPEDLEKLIRRYTLNYRTGDFNKSLLSRISVQGETLATDRTFSDATKSYPYFTKHDFTYRSSRDGLSNGETYAIFAKPVIAGREQAQPKSVGNIGFDGSGSWSSTNGESISRAGFGGIGIKSLGLSASVEGSNANSSQKPLRALVDVNGDGITDVVRRDGDGRLGQVDRGALRAEVDWGGAQAGLQSDDATNLFKNDPAQADWPSYEATGSAGRMLTLGMSRGKSWGFGANASVGDSFGLAASGKFTTTTTQDYEALAHMTPDGILDQVILRTGGGNGIGEVQVWEGTRSGSANPNKRIWGRIPQSPDPQSDKDLGRNQLAGSLPIEPIARWTAPRDGTVQIRGVAQKIIHPQRDRGGGMSAQILKVDANDSEVLWERGFGPAEGEPCVPQAPNGCAGGLFTTVSEGDQLFFRVGSQLEGRPQTTDTLDGDFLK